MAPQAIERTLRQHLEEHRARGTAMPLHEALVAFIRLAREVAARHHAGERLLLHPSAVIFDADGTLRCDPELMQRPVEHPRDRACLAPEHKDGSPGDAQASVFALGAMLYDAISNEHVGPGMRAPSQLVRGAPATLDTVVGKALVADPDHRPTDAAAFAAALGEIDVGSADVHFEDDLDVDVSMSLLPPQPSSTAGFEVSVRDVTNKHDPIAALASLKARLEADKRPRYIVIKDGMDHGPFAAVELLHQVASNAFVEDDVLRDTIGGDSRPIAEWDEFAPFAEQARLRRNADQEKAALAQVVRKEKSSTRSKAIIGVALVGVLLAAVLVAFFATRGVRNDEAKTVLNESGSNADFQGSLKASEKKKSSTKAQGGTIGKGGVPVLSGGLSCSGARQKYEDILVMNESKAPASVSAGQYKSAVMGRQGAIAGCGVKTGQKITICAAVQNGRAVGVTVSTQPSDKRLNACVDGIVRGIGFPSSPYLDITNVWLQF